MLLAERHRRHAVEVAGRLRDLRRGRRFVGVAAVASLFLERRFLGAGVTAIPSISFSPANGLKADLRIRCRPDERHDPDWAPDTWRSRPAVQQPEYPDAAALQAVLERTARLPPLVTSWEILALKQQLAEAQEGKRFLLQGGDCAESFARLRLRTSSPTG